MAAIIGIAIGGGIAVVFVIALTVSLAWCLCLRSRSNTTPRSTTDEVAVHGSVALTNGQGRRHWWSWSRKQLPAAPTSASVADTAVFPDASGLTRGPQKVCIGVLVL